MAEPIAPLCGCDCSLDTPDAIHSSSGLTYCECCHCGTNQACNVACPEIRRCFTALCRGKYCEFNEYIREFRGFGDLTEEFKLKYPKFCGDCMRHGLLQLRVEAVRCARKRRAEFDGSILANQRVCFGSSRF